MQTTPNRAVRLLGKKSEHKESLKVAAAMLVVTSIYEAATLSLNPEYVFNVFEFVGTWSGLVCVWLSRTRNILCWPWGIVSSLSLGIFFGQIQLPGQQWLNLGYFTLIQLWAWPHWAFGGEDRADLPVSTMKWQERFLALLALTIGTGVCYRAIDTFLPGSLYPLLDAIVVASSVIAQFLLGRKMVESWLLWLGPVNALSIILFFAAGAYTLMALYVAFFIHAFVALLGWYRIPSAQGAITT